MKQIILFAFAAVYAATPRERAEQLLSQMNFDEKIMMVHGAGWQTTNYIGNVPPNQRLKIPAINLQDGPQGFRDDDAQMGTSTQWPSVLTMAATWDAAMVESWGDAMGKEFSGKGANVALGPGINVARVPVNGRNFEYISGEDPLLGSRMVGPYIKGMQQNNVIACAKHFINNNQEASRGVVDVIISDRVEMEIYAPPFEAAVQAGVGSFMCSYNKINGSFACENEYTLKKILRDRFGFEGWVMSDWWAVHTTVNSANSGLDQEMPGITWGDFFSQALVDAINRGDVSRARLDEMVLRILTSMFQFNLFDTTQPSGGTWANVTSEEHNKLARAFSAAATTLLQNDGVLPFSSEVKQIAMIGDSCANPITGGGGSGMVHPPYKISPLQGVSVRAGSVKVVYAPTYPRESAVDLARSSDVAVICVGTVSEEGTDRPNLSLQNGEDDLISAVAAVQKTVVVASVPGAILMPWADKVSAILTNFMPGQEAGNALADILFGDVNPGGKLPVTFPNVENEMGFTRDQYPGINNVTFYSEGLLVGYRWYQQKNITARFPFGHGLSYTTFSYRNLSASGSGTTWDFSFDLANSGARNGSEVVQLYLTFPPQAEEPPGQLKDFSKVVVKRGEKARVSLSLNARSFSVWDTSSAGGRGSWVVVPGKYQVEVGASSRDIRLRTTIVVPSTSTSTSTSS